VEARPIGVLEMSDEKGQDDKILTVACGDPKNSQYLETRGYSTALSGRDIGVLQDLQETGGEQGDERHRVAGPGPGHGDCDRFPGIVPEQVRVQVSQGHP